MIVWVSHARQKRKHFALPVVNDMNCYFLISYILRNCYKWIFQWNKILNFWLCAQEASKVSREVFDQSQTGILRRHILVHIPLTNPVFLGPYCKLRTKVFPVDLYMALARSWVEHLQPIFKPRSGVFVWTPGPTVENLQFFQNKMINVRRGGHAWICLSHNNRSGLIK